jgi:glycerol-3-phosphate dehydrogenase (NAD(P)+)
MNKKISVVGAGSWGTTLSILLASKSIETTLWVYEVDQIPLLCTQRVNQKYLPDIPFPEKLNVTGDLATAVQQSDIIVLASPTHVIRKICQQIRGVISNSQLIVNVSKGIENDTLMRMSQVIHEILNIPESNIATLHGPSHAEEVSRKIVTAVVSASANIQTARSIRDIFSTDYFRVYSSTDIIGVELGGALKNIIALAAGICDGAGFGDNTKAALLTRGMVEMTRLGVFLGAQKETFSGLSGIGDLIVTCMSKHSRNRFVGEEIGKGKTLQDILSKMVMVAEGILTTRSAHQLMLKHKIEMPISEQVYEVLFHEKNPNEAVNDLMSRDPKEELSD